MLQARAKKLIDFQVCEDISRWDSDLLSFGLVHPYQTTAFGEFCELNGYRVDFINVMSSNRVIGKCCVHIKGRVARWLYGPVVLPDHLSDYDIIVNGFTRFLSSRGVICVENSYTQTIYGKDFYQNRFPQYLGDYETLYIDLENSMDEICKGFDRSLRKNMRKCNEANVYVEISDNPSLLEVYMEMLHYYRGHMGFRMPPFYPDKDSMQLFSRPHLGMYVAVAWVKGVPLAGLGIVTFGRLMVEVAAAQSYEYHLHNLPANEFIKVKIIDYFKEKGFKLYDLSGIRRCHLTEKEANIRRFKLKFTKAIGEFGFIQRKVLHPVSYMNYRVLNKLKRIVGNVLANDYDRGINRGKTEMDTTKAIHMEG